MDSTQAQEVLERNEEYLKIMVSKFMRRCSQNNRNGIVSREDLMQEITLCFLDEVEKHGEETARRQKYTFLQSMYRAVMTAYPVSVPPCSSRFKKITENIVVERWEDIREKIVVDDFTPKTIDRLSMPLITYESRAWNSERILF